MKKNIYISFILLFFVCLQAFGTVVTERKIYKETPTKEIENYFQSQRETNKVYNMIKSCKPYKENMSYDYMGMNMSFNLKIEGWVDGKCRMNFSADTSGISSSFEKLYGVSQSQAEVYAFAPKIKCDFTQQQLDYVGDSILQEKAREEGLVDKMLKDPNNIDISALNESDAKLLDVIIRQGACKILNTQDLENIMQILY